MPSLRLALAIYGKPPASPDAGGYRFLVRHPDFDPPPVAPALWRLVNAVEWKPAPQPHRHPPVFGCLAQAGFTLVARFLDTGRDSLGRPHALRVECVLWPAARGPVPAALLTGDAWPACLQAEAPEAAFALAPGTAPDARAIPPGIVRILGDRDTFATLEA